MISIQNNDLFERAERLIESNHGILYKSSIGILKHGLKLAREFNDFSDLEEFVPKYEKKYICMKKKYEAEKLERERRILQVIHLLFKSYTKEMLYKRLAQCKRESMQLMNKWSTLRIDERTQRKARISNRADANAQEMRLIQDALDYLRNTKQDQI